MLKKKREIFWLLNSNLTSVDVTVREHQALAPSVPTAEAASKSAEPQSAS
uniref:Uncharacterized protein n=1 Tax=Peronospora matthiolae TaxID=2874970 RepID=A0AAV1TCW3_9STRA